MQVIYPSPDFDIWEVAEIMIALAKKIRQPVKAYVTRNLQCTGLKNLELIATSRMKPQTIVRSYHVKARRAARVFEKRPEIQKELAEGRRYVRRHKAAMKRPPRPFTVTDQEAWKKWVSRTDDVERCIVRFAAMMANLVEARLAGSPRRKVSAAMRYAVREASRVYGQSASSEAHAVGRLATMWKWGPELLQWYREDLRGK